MEENHEFTDEKINFLAHFAKQLKVTNNTKVIEGCVHLFLKTQTMPELKVVAQNIITSEKLQDMGTLLKISNQSPNASQLKQMQSLWSKFFSNQ